jgi:drug/metabolite transporter (DMT)-like permease
MTQITYNDAKTSEQKDKRVNINWMGFFFIALTIAFTVYGQLIIKWQVNLAGAFPEPLDEKAWFIFRLLLNPWVISSFAAAFIASLCWMAAMTQFELSFAYPFMSMSFVIVMVLSFLFMGEKFSWYKVAGTLVIILGLFIVTRDS